MSDSESTLQPAAHPTLGGKSLQSLVRPRYKSWRKKYRKMRGRFDGALEENKRVFKEEHKLEAIAKRLREELEYVPPYTAERAFPIHRSWGRLSRGGGRPSHPVG